MCWERKYSPNSKLLVVKQVKTFLLFPELSLVSTFRIFHRFFGNRFKNLPTIFFVVG
jgi:hypothetical protein